MSQQINDNFQLLAGLPIDDRNKKLTIAERDAITSTRRYQGLMCFVDQTQTLYMLIGGILNSNWVGIAGANTSNALETVIDGFYVLLAGKTTPLDFEVGDKFRGWIGTRYLVGTILSLPVSLPSDIDNPAKVELAIDSDSVIGTLSTDDVANDSGVDGATTTDALNTLGTGKQNNLKKINVEEYGVIGDGVTDNTAALNAMFNNVLSNGTEIVFPKGDYKISDSIIVKYPCTITGYGKSKITQVSADKTALFIDAIDVIIKDIHMENTSAIVTDGSGIVWQKGTRCGLNNVFINNFYKSVSIINGGSWYIINCTLFNPGKYNIHVNNLLIPDEGDSTIQGTTFYSGRYAGCTDIFQESGGGLRIVNSKFNGSGPYVADHHYHAKFNENTGIILIADNSIEAFEVSSIKIELDGVGSSQYLIKNNQISGGSPTLKSFIDIDGGGGTELSLISITDNVFASNPSNTDPVIKIANADGITIAGNKSNAVNDYSLTNCTNVSFDALGTIKIPSYTTNSILKVEDGEVANSNIYEGVLGTGFGVTSPNYSLDVNTPVDGLNDTYSMLHLQSANYGYLIKGGLKQGFGGNLIFARNSAGSFLNVMELSTAGAVKINNLAGTGTRQVVSDASGNLSAVAGTLISTFTDVSTVSTSQETLFTYTLPANTLVNNGDRLKIMVTASSSVANVSGSLEFGGNVFYNYSAVSAGNNNSLFTFIRVNSTTVRVIRNDIGSATNYTVSNLTSATNVFNFKYTSLAGAGGATLKAVSIDLAGL